MYCFYIVSHPFIRVHWERTFDKSPNTQWFHKTVLDGGVSLVYDSKHGYLFLKMPLSLHEIETEAKREP